MKKINKIDNKGITLISLVITIIIMLILTGITINLLFGDNGIITKTKMAKKAFLGEDAREVVEDRVNAYITEYGSKGDLSLYDFWAMYNSSELLDASGNNTGQTNPDYDPNFVIYLFEEEAAVNFTPSLQTGVYDKNTPYLSAVVIYKGYSVTLDKKLGVKGKATAIEDLTEAQISKLENKQIYTISPTGWAREKTITPGTIQGSELYIDASGSMALWDSPIVVTENKTLNYEVRQSGTRTDGGTIEVDKIETTPPTVSTALSGTVNGRTIELSIGVQDTDSGIDHVIFEHKSSSAESYINQTTVNAETAGLTTAQTINATLGSQQSPMSNDTYDIRAKVYDVAGNEYITSKIQVEVDYSNPANPPEISQGMVPVKWNGSNWVVCSTTDSSWYNYQDTSKSGQANQSQWANIMLMDGLTLTDTDYDTESEIKALQTNQNPMQIAQTLSGKTVATMGSMFVWIPRYEYKIVPDSGSIGASSSGSIEVNFISTSTTDASMGYTIHPAFRDEDNEDNTDDFQNGGWNSDLPGIWVAKFEASAYTNATASVTNFTSAQSSTVTTTYMARSLPGVKSWRYTTIGDMYDACRNITGSKATNYGFTADSDQLGTGKTYAHLMKNSEWGAVAYLTHSKYGRNGVEISINTNSRCITGVGSGSTSSTSSVGYTGTYVYSGSNGVKSSTTGNVYGIYDMSGGECEGVAAFNSTGGSSLANGSFTNEGNSTKYATKYVCGDNDDPYDSDWKIGDATHEVNKGDDTKKAWFNDASSSGGTFFMRGGLYSYGETAGVFFASRYSGGAIDGIRLPPSACSRITL